MAFSVRPVREVMTPRTDIVAVDESAALEDIRMVFAQSGYSRIPVYRGTLDDIVGMLHAFDLFKLRPGDPLPVRPVAVTPASRSCGDLLLDMQRERRHLARRARRVRRHARHRDAGGPARGAGRRDLRRA